MQVNSDLFSGREWPRGVARKNWGEAMELNFSEKSVVQGGSHVCESSLIDGAVTREVEESGMDRNVGEL